MRYFECENETEYNQAMRDYSVLRQMRAMQVSENRSRRMRGMPLIAVSELPEVPYIPIAYDNKTGEWEGRLHCKEEVRDGCHIKWERAKW